MNLPVWLQLRTQFFDSITLLTADKLKKKCKQLGVGGRHIKFLRDYIFLVHKLFCILNVQNTSMLNLFGEKRWINKIILLVAWAVTDDAEESNNNSLFCLTTSRPDKALLLPQPKWITLPLGLWTQPFSQWSSEGSAICDSAAKLVERLTQHWILR